jgi:VWFA-related protein
MGQMAGVYGTVLLLAAASGMPQPQRAPEPGPVIRSTTRLVEVEVLVSDKHGPVRGLTQDDFVVTDRGERQAAKLLSADSSAPPASRGANLPRNTFSNQQTAAEGTPPTVTILLLDGLNTRFEDQNRARQQFVRALGQIELGEKDRIAIYVLGKSLRILADFTDPAQTRKVLARYNGRLNTEMDTSEPLAWAVGDPLIDEFIDFTNEVNAQAENLDRARITLSALAAIASHAASIPGRKNLVWVTGGLPVSAESVASFLNSADLSVYPIDARGLIGLPPQWTAASPAIQRNPARGQPMSLSPGGLGNFDDLANATGGRAWINGNDLGQALRNALQDSAAAYTLGFQPNAAGLDGTYHQLRVELRVKRPDLELRYRRGYLAARDSGASDAETAQRMQNAVWSPLEASGLALSAKVVKPDPLHGDILKISCTVDAHQVTLDARNGNRVGALDMLIVQEDGASKVLDSVTGSVDLRFGPAEYDARLKTGVAFYKVIQTKPGLVTLRILVQDHGSGLLGSLIIPASRIAESAER